MARTGDNRKTDLLVRDIFGGAAEDFGLKAKLLASSFGKVNELYLPDASQRKFANADCVKSLMVMICFTVSQLATLVAKQEGLQHICYLGKLTRRGSYAAEYLQYATDYWDKQARVSFHNADGHLGAIGCLLERY